MSRRDFRESFSISPIAGSSFSNFREAFKGKVIDPQYQSKYILSGLFSIFAEPFRWVESALYGKKIQQQTIDEAPVFILGHWRSGTTYLHNLMCQDPNMAFVTTYQGVFPNQLLSARWFFHTMMTYSMPNRRAADNVALGPDYPQEEEFALGNINPYTFYYFWYFPRMTKELCDRYIMMEGITKDVIDQWKKDYFELVKKSILNTKGKRFISKNPPHTGRIPQLLEMFPNAKFIHIYRNPLTVFPSTFNFFSKTIPSISFQTIEAHDIEENIFYVYERMMRKYEEDKLLIPSENLIEIKYEDFEKEPLAELKKIYAQLGLPGFDESRVKFNDYIQSQQEFQVNNHRLSEKTIRRIIDRWQFSMDKWGYEIPDMANATVE